MKLGLEPRRLLHLAEREDVHVVAMGHQEGQVGEAVEAEGAVGVPVGGHGVIVVEEVEEAVAEVDGRR